MNMLRQEVCPPNGTAVLNSLKGVNACFWRNSDPKFVPGGVLSHHPRVIYDTWYMVYGMYEYVMLIVCIIQHLVPIQEQAPSAVELVS